MQNLKLKIFLMLLLITIDFSLFFNELTYRYFFYENLFILLPFGRLAANILIFVFINFLKILDIAFAFNVFALFDPTLYEYVKYLLIAVSSMSLIYFRSRVTLFVVISILTILIDKVVADDQFATSILHRSYHSVLLRNSFQVESRVHDLIKVELSKKNVILINWESLGVPGDKRLVEEVLKNHDGLQYFTENVRSRSTLASEFEYLCEQSLGILNSEAKCIAQNSKSVALHGNSDFLFNRRSLYPKMGFEKVISRSDFKGHEECFYSFRGVCDEDIIHKVINLANEADYNFIYALTLDSHYPYIKYQQHASELYQEVQQVLTSLLSCCGHLYTILIVGDHPPPLSNEFLQNLVPVFVLKGEV